MVNFPPAPHILESYLLMFISNAAYERYQNSYKPYSPELIRWMNICCARAMVIYLRGAA
jgi:hypothetical protein